MGEGEDSLDLVPELRRVSRLEYLKKRETQKLEDLEAELRDEEYLFAESELTPAEKIRLEKKRRLLELAKQRAATDASDIPRYDFPQCIALPTTLPY